MQTEDQIRDMLKQRRQTDADAQQMSDTNNAYENEQKKKQYDILHRQKYMEWKNTPPPPGSGGQPAFVPPPKPTYWTDYRGNA